MGRRKLMTMDEILRMPLEKELVLLRGQKVLMLDKLDYTFHPESGKLVKYHAAEYIPRWFADKIQSAAEERTAASQLRGVAPARDIAAGEQAGPHPPDKADAGASASEQKPASGRKKPGHRYSEKL
ncbi:hypothetical protein FACS1894191_0580 [Clostridia bacterium]|nr:hypothetical protein FACS1894191_0580 [Clostridia bacterium]